MRLPVAATAKPEMMQMMHVWDVQWEGSVGPETRCPFFFNIT